MVTQLVNERETILSLLNNQFFCFRPHYSFLLSYSLSFFYPIFEICSFLMDWDLKIPPPPWDIVSDLDLTTPSGPGPCAPDHSSSSPSPLDLKLNTGISMTPGPAKRQRSGSIGGGHVAVRCLVEGCKADLSKCREYHRRHKVCEMHSKTPVVIVSGREQRFCQQCSR